MGRSGPKNKRSPRTTASASRQGDGLSLSKKRNKFLIQGGLLLVVFIAVGLGVYTSITSSPRSIIGATPTASPSPFIQQASFGKVHHSNNVPQTFADLITLTPEELAEIDLARVNLLCASGLPGAEELTPETIDKMLTRIDQWAARVRLETERHRHWLTDPKHADKAKHFGHSEARFRAEFLVDVLQNDIGVKYHNGFVPADQNVPPFKTSKETFLHGLLDHDDPKQAFGGNCVSLPVIYAAVGRRLGYPIKLVTSNEHVFCRWVGEEAGGHTNKAWRDTFNFDGAGAGFSIDPDEFYLTWPSESNEAEAEIFDWFKPLTPSQEMALFLLARGHIQRQIESNLNAAQTSYTLAANLWPTSRAPLIFITGNASRMWEREYAEHPNILPRRRAAITTTQPAEDQAIAAAQDDRPWWETERGRAKNNELVRQMTHANRLNAVHRQHILRMQQTSGVATPPWPGQPRHHSPSSFPQPFQSPTPPTHSFPEEPWPSTP